MKRRIAITGGIGSGKSTVSKFIKTMGYPVFSCDEIYTEILSEKEYISTIEDTFDGVVKNGVIDKHALSTLIYSNQTARKKLDSLSHPRIMSRLIKRMQKSSSDFVFAEVPLLFEGNFQNQFDYIIVVMRDKARRINAIRQRDAVDEGRAIAKITAQFDYDDKKNAPLLQAENIYLINNNSSSIELEMKVKNSISEIISRNQP